MRSAAFAVVSCAAILTAGCVSGPPAPVTPVAQPTPRPGPVAPPVAAPAPANWLDAPATPGDWTWRKAPSGSEASFAGGQFTMRCDAGRRSVTLLRAAPAATGQRSMRITTTDTARDLVALPSAGGVAASLSASDALLDAMAFSRGRFAIEVAGMPNLYIPSWTEVSRVIEDCR